MENIKVQKLQENDDIRKSVSDIFIEAYYKQLSSISKEKAKLSNAFYNSFLIEHFYGAFVKDELVGIFALSDSNERSFKVARHDFIKNFGFIKGSLAFIAIKKELEQPVYLREKGYFIEAVATKVRYQRQGIGKKMIQYAIENNEYLELYVEDTNIPAIELYKESGFKKFKEVPEKYFKKAKGFNKKLYMYYKK
jgi:ribosomal protein S18 acetylase RimI-like enzyme